MKRTRVFIRGFYYTGSSAVCDLLKDHSDCHVIEGECDFILDIISLLKLLNSGRDLIDAKVANKVKKIKSKLIEDSLAKAEKYINQGDTTWEAREKTNTYHLIVSQPKPKNTAIKLRKHFDDFLIDFEKSGSVDVSKLIEAIFLIIENNSDYGQQSIVVYDQLFDLSRLEHQKFIDQINFPVKFIKVDRKDPRDQFADIIRADKRDYRKINHRIISRLIASRNDFSKLKTLYYLLLKKVGKINSAYICVRIFILSRKLHRKNIKENLNSYSDYEKVCKYIYFEDLVMKPKIIIEGICEFLGISNMSNHLKSFDPSKSKKNIGIYKKYLTDNEVSALNKRLG